MHVAIDSGPLTSGHSVRGVGFYTSELIDALKQTRIGLEKIIVDEFDFAKDSKYLTSDRYDIVHFTAFSPYRKSIPMNLQTKAKVVVTIHDMIPVIYEKHYSPGLRGRMNYHLQRIALKRVDAVLVPTETTKKDVVRFLGVEQDKVQVTYEAPGSNFKKIESKTGLKKIAAKFKLPKTFAMFLGDINYNKNIENLILACSKAKIKLVIAGKHAKEVEAWNTTIPKLEGPRDWIRFLLDKPHPEIKHFENLKNLFLKHDVRTLGFVSDEDLVALFNLATVYIQPSFYEGFGLPVLQAMACGTPVIINKTQALVEIAGSAAMVVDCNNGYEKLVKAIGQVAKSTDLQSKMQAKGIKLSKEYTWKKSALITANVYKMLLKDEQI